MDLHTPVPPNNLTLRQESLNATIHDILLNIPRGEPKNLFLEIVWPKLQKDYHLLVQDLIEYCKGYLDANEVPALVEGRAKLHDSIKKSLDRREEHRVGAGKQKYQSLEEIFEDIHDLAGVRIIVDYPSDIERVDTFVRCTFEKRKEPNVFSKDRKVGEFWEAWFGAYKSCNHHVSLRPKPDAAQVYCFVIFEIQLTSLPESLYNKLAHPLLYKQTAGSLSRKDEMIIDLSHGVSLCYSICLLYMQDKSTSSSARLKEPRLRDAMRATASTPRGRESEESLNELANRTPFSTSGNVNSKQNSNLKRQASCGQTISVESLLNILLTLPNECDPTESLWTTFTNKIQPESGLVVTAIRDHTKEMQRINFDEKDQACLKDLRVVDPENHKKTLQRTKGGLMGDVYRWILDNEEFCKFKKDPECRLLWVKGGPGKGKTMLLCGIIDELAKDTSHAMSYFFCQATDNDKHRSATAVLRSLIWLLCNKRPHLLAHVREKYNTAGKDLFEDVSALCALEEILENILREPDLENAFLIIDALDECSDGSLIIHIVTKFSQLLPAKWIVSSRNWPTIEEQLQHAEKIKVSLELNMQSISKAVGIFIENKVNHLVRVKGYSPAVKEQVLQTLRCKSNDTFLWVALVCLELERPEVKSWNTMDKLKSIPGTLKKLYERMLDQIFMSDNAGLYKQILATACIAFRSMTLEELSGLIKGFEYLGADQLKEAVNECGSFLIVSDDTVYFVHQSAQEFLKERENRVFTSGVSKQHLVVFQQSLTLFSKLRRNMYNLQSPGVLIQEISRPDIDPLSPLEYSCVYWVDHLYQSHESHDQSDLENVYDVLKTKLLYWLEALCLRSKIPEGMMAIRKLNMLVGNNTNHALSAFVKDVQRFVLSHRQILEIAPLQVYASALLFSPGKSTVRDIFKAEEPGWFRNKPNVPDYWNACIQTLEGPLEGYDKRINSIAFLRNNEQLISLFLDDTFRIWNVSSDQCIQVLDWEWPVRKFAASPNSQQIAIASMDGEIKLWNADSKVDVHEIGSAKDDVTDLAFSPNGQLLALCTSKGRIEMWHLTTNSCIWATSHCQEEMCYYVGSISFSSDGGQLGSGGDDAKVKLWDTATGRCIKVLEGDYICVTSVAFSPDDPHLLASSSHNTIRIWNAAEGTCIQTINTHANKVRRVVYLGPGHRLASTSDGDSTIKIWDHKGSCVQTLKGHNGDIASLAFSQNLQLLASASYDKVIKVWDLSSTPYSQHTNHHRSKIDHLILSRNGQWLVSSSITEQEIKIWSTSTLGCIYTIKDDTLHYRSKLTLSSNDRWLMSSESNDYWHISSDRHQAQITLWDTSMWDTSNWPYATSFRCYSASIFSPDGNLLALKSEAYVVVVLDMTTLNEIQHFYINMSPMAFSFDNQYLFLLERYKNDIFMYNVMTGAKTQSSHFNILVPVKSIFLSLDTQWLVAHLVNKYSSYLDRLVAWNLRTGTNLDMLPTRGIHPFLLSFSASNKWVAIDEDTCPPTIKVWDMNTNTLIFNSPCAMSIRSLQFDPTDDSRLITNLGTIRLDTTYTPHSSTRQGEISNQFKYLGYNLSNDASWVFRGSERILWLPSEYRPGEIHIMGSTIAIGCVSGFLLKLEFL